MASPADILRVLAQVEIELTQEFLGRPGQRAGFLVLAGLILGFLFIRTSARLIRMQVSWWPGNVETSSGLHIHHLVWGILTIMLTGFLSFSFQPGSPWLEMLAVAFGIGCGLTLDEFALWLHLEDVYWSEEGRSSVDAVFLAVMVGWLIIVGIAPFDSGEQGSVLAIMALVASNIALALICVTKGKLITAVLGAFIPLIGIVGAIRLGRPASRWGRRRYKSGSRKLRRATERAKWIEDFQNRVVNLIGGRPSEPDPPATGADGGAGS